MRNYYQEPQVVKKGGFLGKLVALLLGFVMGFLGLFGGIGAAGMYLGSMPLNEAATTIDSYTGLGLSALLFGTENEQGVLDAAYADKYVKDLFEDTVAAITNLANGGTLNDFNTITPKVEELINKLLETTDKYGIPFTAEALLNTPINAGEGETSFVDYFLETAKSTPLAGILTALGDKPNGLLLYLCYGEEGVDYEVDAEGNIIPYENTQTTVGDLLKGDLMAIFKKVPISAVINPTIGDSPMLTIAYGREGVTYRIKNSEAANGTLAEVEMLPLYYEMKGTGFVDYSGAAFDCTITGNQETIDGELYVQFALPANPEEDPTYLYFKNPVAPETKHYVYQKQADGSMKAQRFSKTKLSDLTSDAMGMLDKVLLKDVLNVDDDGVKTQGVLQSLCFDKNGNPNSIGDLRNKGGELINEIPLDTIMTPDANSAIVLYLLYGHEGVHYNATTANGKTTYTMLQKFIAVYNGKVYDEYGKVISGCTLNETNKTCTIKNVTYNYTVSETDTITLKNVDNGNDATVKRCYLSLNGEPVMFEKTALGEFSKEQNKIGTITSHLTLKDIFGDNVDDNQIFASLKDSTLDDLPDEINNLTLGEIITIDNSSPAILKALQNATLNNIGTEIDSLTLGEIITIDNSSPAILKALQGATLSNIGTEIDGLELGEIITIDDNSPAILKALQDATLSNIGTEIDSLTLGEIVTIDDNSPAILKALQGATLSNIGTEIDGLKLGEIITIDSSSPAILIALQHSTLSDIGKDVNNLTLQEIITIDKSSPAILKKLGSSKLSEMSTAINDLTVSDALGDVSDNKILCNFQSCKITDLPTEINKLTVEQMLHDQIYRMDSDGNYLDENGNVTTDKTKAVSGTWKYLLKDGNTIRTDYTLMPTDTNPKGMNALIDNMTRNIHDATLIDLKNDNLIDFNDSMLSQDIKKKIGPIDFTSELPASIRTKNTLGELTVTEMLSYIDVLFKAIALYEATMSGGLGGM